MCLGLFSHQSCFPPDPKKTKTSVVGRASSRQNDHAADFSIRRARVPGPPHPGHARGRTVRNLRGCVRPSVVGGALRAAAVARSHPAGGVDGGSGAGVPGGLRRGEGRGDADSSEKVHPGGLVLAGGRGGGRGGCDTGLKDDGANAVAMQREIISQVLGGCRLGTERRKREAHDRGGSRGKWTIRLSIRLCASCNGEELEIEYGPHSAEQDHR